MRKWERRTPKEHLRRIQDSAGYTRDIPRRFSEMAGQNDHSEGQLTITPSLDLQRRCFEIPVKMEIIDRMHESEGK